MQIAALFEYYWEISALLLRTKTAQKNSLETDRSSLSYCKTKHDCMPRLIRLFRVLDVLITHFVA